VTSPRIPSGGNEEFWRDFLTRGAPGERRWRGLMRRLPSETRCKLCAAPFQGPGGGVMRIVGKYPSPMDPKVCNACFDFMEKNRGGAEIEVSLVFADIRSSTSIAERLSATDFRVLLDRFYSAASEAIYDNDGAVDKFVGDEIVAYFFPLLSGPGHARHAVDAALGILRATGHGDPSGPWVPVGVGVHSGPAWVGAVVERNHVELTALGDNVNVTARLASAAQGGEVLVTADAMRAAGLEMTGREHRSLELKGRQQTTDVVSLSLAST